MNLRLLITLMAAVATTALTHAEDGYDLWLRYQPLSKALQSKYAASFTQLAVPTKTDATSQVAIEEIQKGVHGMFGTALKPTAKATKEGAIAIGTLNSFGPRLDLRIHFGGLGDEAFMVGSAWLDGKKVTVVTGKTSVGVLYGTFWLLRQLQTGQSLPIKLSTHSPKIQHRLLNHWDNLNRTVERGYAGQSIWDWHKLPGYVDPKIKDYARANASIGINGSVLTNVNSNSNLLRPDFIAKAAAIADTLRPYGIRVYLTARFSAPIELGKLKTADPLEPEVQAWWKEKAEEIYKKIPDFGGFVVKANSEGQPGPQNYKRTHADGANMLADAVAPHGGIVMWRAFVYSSETPRDRALQAYDEFVPLDGKFRDNVIVQVKNGPIDFQPREPYHPLFGAMKQTPTMMEVQVTKEYLGFATHIAYLGTMWEEVLRADTDGRGTTVGKIVDGSVFKNRNTAMCGVANIGSDRNWCGSNFDQANWYALGRFAWDHTLSAEKIAGEWARMTFGNDPTVVRSTVDIMMRSREAVVDYMTPLGLTHLMDTGHHYGPGPWVNNLGRTDWNPTYYHRADKSGIGFDRTSKGSDSVGQYPKPWRETWNSVETTPDNLLLWFHHLPWNYKMRSGNSLWVEMVARYSHGVDEVREMSASWSKLKGKVDKGRFDQVSQYLTIQEKEAKWWRDACLAYFQSINGLPFPPGFTPPAHPLEYYKSITHPYAPGNGV